MSISFDSIGQVCVTCYNKDVRLNQPCKLTTNCTVAPCEDMSNFEGVVVASKDGLATVAVKGFVTLPYTGNAPVLGFCPIAATGTGKVKMQEGAHEYVVFNVDTNKKTVTFCL